ncbi:AbrB family transcriptional regulator [Cyanobium sp. NIES-981]|uniref:AbrB family transcriptional regulator n=1 Tax=Cyanobium sp. NIES-981 TaxID=1851505 RepID=UPI001CEC3EA6|nr:AbrB family transcriptional regulator [Cyanobium sp. NIES-981]
MLEGQALLDKARALSNQPEDQIARACGYVGPSGRVLRKSFYRALVAAKGYAVPESAAGRSDRSGGQAKGRQAEFRTRVHGNGNLLIGHAYTRRLGLEPGQEFRIELHRETGAIWLLPLEESSNQEPASAEAGSGEAPRHQSADEQTGGEEAGGQEAGDC